MQWRTIVVALKELSTIFTGVWRHAVVSFVDYEGDDEGVLSAVERG